MHASLIETMKNSAPPTNETSMRTVTINIKDDAWSTSITTNITRKTLPESGARQQKLGPTLRLHEVIDRKSRAVIKKKPAGTKKGAHARGGPSGGTVGQ